MSNNFAFNLVLKSENVVSNPCSAVIKLLCREFHNLNASYSGVVDRLGRIIVRLFSLLEVVICVYKEDGILNFSILNSPVREKYLYRF